MEIYQYHNYPIWNDMIIKSDHTPYKIVRRGSEDRSNDITVPISERVFSDFQLQDRDYSKPLCGYSNYSRDIKIGDKISVKMTNTFNIDYSKLTKEYIKPKFRELYKDIPLISDSVIFTEEHFFKITGIDGDNYKIEPFYIDGGIIRHPFYINLEATLKIKKDHLEENKLIDFWEINGNRDDNIDIKYIYETYYEFILDLFKRVRCCKSEKKIEKAIEKLKQHICIPYKYIISIKDEYVEKYFNVIVSNDDIIQKYFTDNEMDTIGTYSLYKISKYEKKLYREILNKLDHTIDYEPDISEYSDHHFYPQIDKPYINHNLNTVDYKDIYRVYSDDSVFTYRSQNIYSNDHYIYNDNVIDHIVEGDMVNLDFYKDSPNIFIYKNYFSILKRDGNRVLAILENYGGNDHFEDIIIEFPLENINQLLRDVDSCMTEQKKENCIQDIIDPNIIKWDYTEYKIVN